MEYPIPANSTGKDTMWILLSKTLPILTLWAICRVSVVGMLEKIDNITRLLDHLSNLISKEDWKPAQHKGA